MGNYFRGQLPRIFRVNLPPATNCTKKSFSI
nr:MAG TPA: hypothetical protein [Caudoviricetes sp.]